MANKFARELRKRLTPQEVNLWVKLRALKELGFHFRRQAPVGGYIVDFASFRDGLIIEVDGGRHNMAQGMSRDAARDAFLSGEGFRVPRFWNSDIDRNLDGVMHVVWAGVAPPPPDPASLRYAGPPSPREDAGEGLKAPPWIAGTAQNSPLRQP